MRDQELNELLSKIATVQERLTQSQEQTDKQLKELGKQIGGLGEKFGSFTEGIAVPSIEKLLREQFKMDVVGLRVKSKKNGHTMELDVLAYANSDIHQAYIVEIKSHLREEGLQQILKHLETFPTFFPEHQDKELYGILACVDSLEELEKRVIQSGIYLAKIHDETFALRVPENFHPKSFQ